jgi:hypothetical protein
MVERREQFKSKGFSGREVRLDKKAAMNFCTMHILSAAVSMEIRFAVFY